MDLTIIILTTDGRELLLNNALEYYKNLNCRIIVVDDGIKQKKLKKFAKLKYFRLRGKSFEKRLQFAVLHSKTKYILNSQDDDFINLGLVKKGINLLNKEKKFSWVGGDQIFFEKYFGIYLFNKIKIFASNKNIFLNNKDHLSKNIIERVFFFYKYQPQLYASLFRKKDLIKALDDWHSCNLKLFYKKRKIDIFYELPYSLFMSIHGNYYHFRDIWQFRDGYANPNFSNDYLGYISRFVTDVPKNEYKKSKAVKTLKKYIFKKLRKKISRNSFEAYFNDIVDYRYKKETYTDIYKKNSFYFKIFLKKNFNLIFLIFKKINRFFTFIRFLIINKYSIKFDNKQTKDCWIKIEKILKSLNNKF